MPRALRRGCHRSASGSGTEQWCPPAPGPLCERQGHNPSVCCRGNWLLCIQLQTPPAPARMQIPQAVPCPRSPHAYSAAMFPVPPGLAPLATSLPRVSGRRSRCLSTQETTVLPRQAQGAGTAGTLHTPPPSARSASPTPGWNRLLEPWHP